MDPNLQHEERLTNIGLDKTQIKNILKGKSTLENLLKTLDSGNVQNCDKKVGNLLYQASTKITPSIENRRGLLTEYIVSGKIQSNQQLEAALEYLLLNKSIPEVDLLQFDQASGVGINLTPEDIKNQVADFINFKKQELLKIRYLYVFTEYMKQIRNIMPFADGGVLTKELKSQIDAILGPKTAEDDKLIEEARKKKSLKSIFQILILDVPVNNDAAEEDKEPKKNIKDLVARDMASSVNTEKLLQWKKERFGDSVLTRFPPEPNGYLHIGHAKSIRFNFTLASENQGQTYLRFDDTNPEKECQEFIDNIKENLKQYQSLNRVYIISFLGYKPFKTTYASENFEQLYGFAVKLIKKGKAFACFLSKAESSDLRRAGKPSPYRETPIEETLKIFEGMRMGLYKENEVCLRAKIDYTHPNTTLRDPAIYRIRYTPHPHAGNKWCIYPLYDFTHCICDSLEGITHSCCTLEFEIRRELYYWLLEQLDLYRAFVWEFSRLNVSNTVLSKRKLHRLVFENIVDGWDDPRILTLNGLRRRGYTADSINDFCDLVSVTRRGNENIIGMHVLEHCLRQDLDTKAPRTMAIIDPVLVEIVNLEADEQIKVSYFPKSPEKGQHFVTLSRNIFVDRSDIRTDDHDDFWGIGPNKTIGLKYCGAFKVLDVIKNGEGVVTEVKLEKLKTEEKPKGFLHWLSQKEAVTCETRLYDYLFNVYDPNELEDYIQGINKDSKIVFKTSKMHNSLLTCKKEDRYQFERLGYFNVDFDTDIEKGHFVWNRTVTLQEREKVKAMAKVDDKPVKSIKQKEKNKQKL